MSNAISARAINSRATNASAVTIVRTGGSSAKAIIAAGLICGVMDITAALVVYGRMGLAPIRLLQGIASGILGPSAFQGGAATAALGLFLHFVIAFGAATIFYIVSRYLRFLVRHAVPFGVLYGIAVYFFMQNVVVPLSLVTRHPFRMKVMLIGVVIHIFCVGLPISLNVRRFGE